MRSSSTQFIYMYIYIWIDIRFVKKKKVAIIFFFSNPAGMSKLIDFDSKTTSDRLDFSLNYFNFVFRIIYPKISPIQRFDQKLYLFYDCTCRKKEEDEDENGTPFGDNNRRVEGWWWWWKRWDRWWDMGIFDGWMRI